ncbi:NAD-dependent epimerase/dehydratase family protein [Tamlana fucoidanivorans]|uniref:NAD-dependent epimerase/dehydratase family protein n=1 Tax=Allotamlana fucoidanivorans TaxID=2583814 RepID=A0A5C4SMW6_9FLAO|nr:NAD-dependent epimerase/dehydratase family protein [Tamlana fucoidanivorans]TNJ44683.1 NAD-dependent epimerase/dehydratase family protein [Tamlana fucoidanivorans]
MSDVTRVFITGVSGLLGTNTVHAFLEAGYQVSGLVRKKVSFVGTQHKHLQLIEGDILNKMAIEKHMKGCEFVIHIAALSDPKEINYKRFHQVNVIGTKNIVESAIICKVKKVIYVSTANVFGYGNLNNLGHELMPIKTPFLELMYSKSKKKAQEYVLSKKDDIEVVSINPTFMLGAYDTKPSSGKLVLYGLRKLILCPPGGKSFVCVKDVATGIVKAIENGENGASYILSNNHLSYKAFFSLLAKLHGTNSLILSVPKLYLRVIGFVGDILRKFHVKVTFSSNNISVLCVSSFYSNKKAKEELGVTFSPIEEGMTDAINWFATRKS